MKELNLKEYKKLTVRTFPYLGWATLTLKDGSTRKYDADYDHCTDGGITELLEELPLAIAKKDSINIGEELADAEWYYTNLATHLSFRLKTTYEPDPNTDHALNLMVHSARLVDYHKKAMAYGRAYPKTQVIKESVEAVLEAIQHTADVHGVNLPLMRARVILKLYDRYPDGFSEDKAIMRDLLKERATLEGNK